MGSTSNSYDLFARYYDKLHYNEFSLLIVHYMDDILAKLNFSGIKILDLGCGTGTASIWYAQQGYNVTAIDSSIEMIKSAHKKARKNKCKIHFEKMEMQKMHYKSQFDLVVCLFDSLNHLINYQDLQDTFHRISEALDSEGYFLFDTITPWELNKNWNNTSSFDSDGNISLILTSKYDRKNRTSYITGHFKIKKGSRILTLTRHFQNHAFTRKEIKKALKNAGLSYIDSYQCFSFEKPDLKSNRIFYITQKLETRDQRPETIC